MRPRLTIIGLPKQVGDAEEAGVRAMKDVYQVYCVARGRGGLRSGPIIQHRQGLCERTSSTIGLVMHILQQLLAYDQHLSQATLAD
jgi:hypothetical protein